MAVNHSPNPLFDNANSKRKAGNFIVEGIIVEAQYDTVGAPEKDDENIPHWDNCEDRNKDFRGPLYRVNAGDRHTYWLPQMALRAGGDIEYWAYEVGERVLIACPDGEFHNGIIIGAMYKDDSRPPVGHDDNSGPNKKDKRPWRESVHRIRYKDGRLWEYDRYLHRLLEVYPDGRKSTKWFFDDREDRTARKKETNSDKTGVPPRHWEHDWFPDRWDYEVLWDEDTKICRRHWKWADKAVFEYQWDEENQTHWQHWLQADGTDYQYLWDEKNQLHLKEWVWKDGYKQQYEWDEKAQTHNETTIYADGSKQRYHYDEKNNYHIDETAYSDGTIIRYHYNEPHLHEILYTDGSSIVYDLSTHKLTTTIVGDVDLLAEGNIFVQTQKNCTVVAEQNIDATAQQSISATASENITAKAGQTASVDAKNISATASENITAKAGQTASVDAKDISASASGTLKGTGGGKVHFVAPEIKLEGNVEITGSISMGGGGSIKGDLNCEQNIKAGGNISG
ncbi:MAG: phage baseplate assembly protein V, partial [Thiotrichaceae bacterium]|nr:phage baseplate assembly protein V [Thiotrichaceae bacterium]